VPHDRRAFYEASAPLYLRVPYRDIMQAGQHLRRGSWPQAAYEMRRPRRPWPRSGGGFFDRIGDECRHNTITDSTDPNTSLPAIMLSVQCRQHGPRRDEACDIGGLLVVERPPSGLTQFFLFEIVMICIAKLGVGRF